jgi:hypothetical protein
MTEIFVKKNSEKTMTFLGKLHAKEHIKGHVNLELLGTMKESLLKIKCNKDKKTVISVKDNKNKHNKYSNKNNKHDRIRVKIKSVGDVIWTRHGRKYRKKINAKNYDLSWLQNTIELSSKSSKKYIRPKSSRKVKR